jgi:glycerol uptake facilitator-like aquaporin
MMKYLPDIILLVVGLLLMVFLLLLGAMSENWVTPVCFLGVAVVYFGWHRTLVNLMWHTAGKDPDDYDFHLPG